MALDKGLCDAVPQTDIIRRCGMVMAVRDLLGAFPALLPPCRRHPGAIGPDSEGSEQG